MTSILDFKVYTIGWIAPLEIEAQAAMGMMDNLHEGHFQLSKAMTTFTQQATSTSYGIGSAAALASQLKKCLPNLWFALLVGIAAGLPDISRNPPRDIRLGDVLVCVPEGTSVGLVHYDLGKETSNGFAINGRQAETATIVRSAIGNIKLRAKKSGAVFLKYLEQLQAENKEFLRPSKEKDILHETAVEGGVNVQRIVKREPRDVSDLVKVWYGNIGSGNSLMKHSDRRDVLRDTHNLIGLEMEGAGIMNFIPVGIIRGVCDYGDSYKNDDWQPYAAAVAAAYARQIFDIIGRRSSAKLQQKDTAGLSGNEMKVSQYEGIHSVMPDSSEISRVLEPAILSIEITQIDYDRCPGTGSWLFEDDIFTKWVSGNDPGILLIQGSSGSGKTYLTSGVVSHLQQHYAGNGASLTYFFCDSKTEGSTRRSSTALFRTITAQILETLRAKQADFVRSHLENLSSLLKSKELPVGFYFELIQKCFKFFRLNYLVVDGLDECDNWREVLDFLNRLRMEMPTQLRVVISSQDTFGIPFAVLHSLPPIFVIRVDSGKQEGDITQFVKERTEGCDFRDMDRERGVNALIEGCQGSFLLAKCRCETLIKDILPQKGDVETAIKDLPEKAVNYYRRPLAALDGTNRYLAREIFAWIMFAKAPLSESELIAGSEIKSLTALSDIPPRLNSRGIEYLRLGLINNGQEYLRFAHSTIADFISSYDWDDNEPSSFTMQKSGIHFRFMQICISYLSQPNLINDIFSEELAAANMTERWPFLRYATENWLYHLLLATSGNDKMANEVGHFLQSDGGLAWWANLIDHLEDHNWWSIPSVVSQLLKWLHEYPPKKFSVKEIATTLCEKHVARFDTSGSQKNLPKYVRALVQLSTQRAENNEFEEAMKILSMVFDVSPQLPLKLQIPITARSLIEKSRILRYQGRFDEAKTQCENAISLLDPTSNDDERNIINTKRLLGEILMDLQCLEESEEQLRLVFTLAQHKLLPSDPDTLAVRNALALTCDDVGKVNEAEKLLAFEHFELALGKDHPSTWTGLGNLAWIFYEKGKISNAIKIWEFVFEKKKHSQGKSVAESTSIGLQLIDAYNSIGKESLANNLMRELFEQSKSSLGEYYRLQSRLCSGMAFMKEREGNLSRGLKILEDLVAEISYRYGREHSWTWEAMAALALMLQRQGELQKAETMQRAVLEERKKTGDENNPAVLDAMAHLASTLRDRGQLEEAETMQRAVLEGRKKTGDENNPVVLRAMAKLASTLRDRGQLEEAETMQRAVLEERKKTGDENNPVVLRAMASLPITKRHRGDYTAAINIQEQIIYLMSLAYGEEDDRVTSAMGNLAIAKWGSGKPIEAEAIQMQVLEHYKTMKSENSIETLIASVNLALLKFENGKLEEAIELEDHVLACIAGRGERIHPGLQIALKNLATCKENCMVEKRTLGRMAVEETAAYKAAFSSRVFADDFRR